MKNLIFLIVCLLNISIKAAQDPQVAQNGYESPIPTIVANDGERPRQVRPIRLFSNGMLPRAINIGDIPFIETEGEKLAPLQNQFEFAIKHSDMQKIEEILKKEKFYRSLGWGQDVPKLCDTLYCDDDCYENCENTDKTPLMFAIQYNHKEKMQLYIDYGANFDVPDYQGNVAFHYAVMKRCMQGFNLLAQNFANPNIKNNNGCAPLLMATKFGYPEYVNALLGLKADPNCQDLHGTSPLHHTALYETAQHQIIANLLLQHPKINVNIQDCNLQTPAHKVALKGTTLLLKLKEKGADFNIQDCHKRSALQYAMPDQKKLMLQTDAQEQLHRFKKLKIESKS